MTTDEKIELRLLNQKCRKLEARIAELEAHRQIEFVTPKELSLIFNCSLNNIYIKIRQGDIKAIAIGRSYQIPMSQFQERSDSLKWKIFHTK